MLDKIYEKLNDIKIRYNELEKSLSEADVTKDIERYTNLSKEHADLNPLIVEFERYKDLEKQKEESEVLLEEEDSEIVEMAHKEIKSIKEKLEEVELNLSKMLLPKDPLDEKNVIIEIRAGTGGDEAALFAADLLRMYMRFAEIKKWKLSLYSANEIGRGGGGYKEVIFSISGKNAYSKLKYEGGVHRVQRVPETEASGRVHTSAVTVAVLPEMDDIDIHIDTKDLRVETFRASGCGGQHVNTTDSAVRITHIPTGVVVSCQDEKSQLKNKTKAMKILRARIYEKTYEDEINKRTESRRIMVGSGDRSEKIRTYNYPQTRVTDHRINLTLYKLPDILNGDLDEIIDALTFADEVEKLKKL
jgi:peptide chain release factor 1